MFDLPSRRFVQTLAGVLIAAGLTLGSSPTLAAQGKSTESEASTDADKKDAAAPWTFGAGVRIGGYGFRHARNAKLSWTDCRMNGTGLFATLDYRERFFGELSFDFYHATGKTVASGMDRLSLFALGAIGVRMLDGFFIRPYIQAGVGPEWTRLDVAGRTKRTLLAAPFMGVGGEINLGRLKLGSHLRVFAMGVPDHLDQNGHSGHNHAPGGERSLHYEVAGQGQFFARYTF